MGNVKSLFINPLKSVIAFNKAVKASWLKISAIETIAAGDLLKIKQADGGAEKKITEANLSAQIQDDLIANPTNYNALGILMKGYKEYTFAIRQSGTDAPVLYLIKDDTMQSTPLVATYSGVGIYNIYSSSLGFDSDNVNILVGKEYDISGNYCRVSNESSQIQIQTYNTSGVLSNDRLDDSFASFISIRETLAAT